METLKKTFRYLLSIMVIAGLGACSSTSNLPNDDLYYSSSKAQTPSQYNWDDFQKNAQNQSGTNVKRDEAVSYVTEYSDDAGSGIVTEDGSTEYEFIDEYYDSDYASRISRFNGEGTSNDYYDESYTNCGGCSSPNMSFSFGSGMGMGYGWSMGYNYGWPYYDYGWPYYSWGYPYYRWGYPYYGSYWSGYNNGYWNGYWDGYYNGGGYYGGGYYSDYAYGNTTAYGPRGRGAGGSTIPRSGNERSGIGSNPTPNRIVDDENIVSRSGGHVVTGGTTSKSYTAPRSGSSPGSVNPKSRPESSIRVAEEAKKQPEAARLQKPEQAKQSNPAKATERYQKSSTTNVTLQRQTPKYQKPKAYESLPSRQPRSSKEYVKPTNTSTKSSATKSNTSTFNRSTKQTNSQRNYTTPRTNSSAPSTKTVKTRTTSTPKSYSAPSRSSSSSGTKSTPSRSYSAPSRSSSSGTTSSSSSSSSSSRSSSSSSKSSGGRR